MSLSRRQMLAATIASSAFLPRNVAAHAQPVAGTWRELRSGGTVFLSFVPGEADETDRLEALLARHQSARQLVVAVPIPITPTVHRTTACSEWIALFERYGVDRVVEVTLGASFETPPLRCGQIDPAGIVYERKSLLTSPRTG